MEISVIVTTYNRAGLLHDALASLAAQDRGGAFPHEIIVVDNASTDETAAVVRRFATDGCPVRYLFEPVQGVAAARNRGVREAAGTWLAFFDDDQRADPRWLGELVRPTAAGASCVGGRVILDLAAGTAAALSPHCRSLLGEADHGTGAAKLTGKSLPGTGNVLLDRTIFTEVGMFDESLSKGCEDTDFFRRVKAKGYEMWYAPQAVVHHVIPPYRLTGEYLRWVSLRQGVNYACLDHKAGGLAATLPACLGRIGQALAVNVPCLLWSRLTGNRADAEGRRCLLAKAAGYTRESLFLLSPTLFPQTRFFDRLDFRGERQSFS
ncbi:glycosyltransferase family 2 protein [Geobacter pickeringii]|uniref:Glycosyltransferase 2-like domain-containing protein n=1 Tax=Geobacter pickeringii TaxID=345632 RepID=A0A0B5BFF3_9BACT|nr:glycosyltransferase [Geobacter pickeringii]AJE02801.1 hypothetical protein GPICK_04965 [Geobacter pickeringii]